MALRGLISKYSVLSGIASMYQVGGVEQENQPQVLQRGMIQWLRVRGEYSGQTSSKTLLREGKI